MFVSSLDSCSGMFHYGWLIDNRVLIFLNGVGTTLQIIYTITFLLIVQPKVYQFHF